MRNIITIALTMIAMVTPTMADNATIAGLLPFWGTSQVPVTSPNHPYCGKQPEDFAIPTVECPDDGKIYSVNVDCVQSCAFLYQQFMAQAYTQACNAYDAAYLELQGWKEVINELHVLCLQGADTEEEEAECDQTHYDLMMQAYENFDAEVATIESELEAATDAITQQFHECAADCCIPIVEQ